MQIFVHGTDSIFTTEALTVAELKREVETRGLIPVDDQVLTYAGRPLEGDVLLAEYGLCENATVELTGRLLGGKVHGSLARAGKVRGQTPKVEPQEKKKQKTGRAKRRRQYGRRFKNVVAQGPGRRRGPNSNMGK